MILHCVFVCLFVCLFYPCCLIFDFEMECPFTITFNITKTAAYPSHYCSVVYICIVNKHHQNSTEERSIFVVVVVISLSDFNNILQFPMFYCSVLSHLMCVW